MAFVWQLLNTHFYLWRLLKQGYLGNSIIIVNTFYVLRLYTGPKDSGIYNTLSSTQAYEKVMENNVDLGLSFNSWDISIEKTLNTSKCALFADSAFFDWGQAISKHPKDLSCLVRLE